MYAPRVMQTFLCLHIGTRTSKKRRAGVRSLWKGSQYDGQNENTKHNRHDDDAVTKILRNTDLKMESAVDVKEKSVCGMRGMRNLPEGSKTTGRMKSISTLKHTDEDKVRNYNWT